jgi:hypothetical protein
MLAYAKIKPLSPSLCCWIRAMVFIATFNNISVISWRSVLLVDENGEPGENHRFIASHWPTLSHNVISSTPCCLDQGVFIITSTFCSKCGCKCYTLKLTTFFVSNRQKNLRYSIYEYLPKWEKRLYGHHRLIASHWPTLSHNVISSTPCCLDEGK